MTFELDESFDVATRELCPDGSCTGVLDDAGVCKVCGLRGTPPAARAESTTATSDADGEAPGDSAGSSAAAAAVGEADFLSTRGDDDRAEFDEARQLCPDGNCIGVLDSDGRCKVCGRSIS